jgi:hypothetical protein
LIVVVVALAVDVPAGFSCVDWALIVVAAAFAVDAVAVGLTTD